MVRARFVWALSVVTIFGAATAARAQDAPASRAGTDDERKPLVAGLSLGAATVSFRPTTATAPPAKSYTGVGVTLWGTWRFADRFGVAVDTNVVDRSGVQYTQGTILIGLQYWATKRIWVKGGAGWGVLNSTSPQIPVDDYGPALGAAVGAEITTWRRFGIDVDGAVRFTRTRVRGVGATSLAAQLGFSKRFAVSTTTTAARPAAHEPPKRKTGRNVFGFEIAGRSGLAGLVYERELGARVGIGVGAGPGWDIILENGPGLIPLYASWSPAGDTHRFYTGAGVAFAHVSSSLRDYFVNFKPRIGWSVYRTGTVGYEHRLKNNEGFWRLGLNVWYQPFGVPGGLLNMQDSGFAFVPAFSMVWRF